MTDIRLIQCISPRPAKEVMQMWLPEELARIRCQEFMNDAQRHREARRFTAGRAWRWLARFAAAKAQRSLR